MGLSLNEIKKKISNLPHAVANDVHDIISHPEWLLTGPGAVALAEAHHSGLLGKALNAAGLGHVLGGGGGGGAHHEVTLAKGGPGSGRSPRPGDMPILSRDGKTACADVEGGQPFTLNAYKSLAAGAQTQGTDIVDFHAAASNPTVITNDDLVLGNVEVFEADLFIGARAVTTAGFEGVPFYAQGWVIEYVNGIEKARWSMRSLGAGVGIAGVLTSGAVFGQYDIDSRPAIAWHRKYDPNIKAKTAYQISVTTTTILASDFAFVEEGVRP